MMRGRSLYIASGALAATAVLLVAGGKGPKRVPTTLDDFFLPGTQPFDFSAPDPPVPLDAAFDECVFCHGGYSPHHAPFDTWKASIMSQSARDPLFLAALVIAEQDAAFSGDLCLRCHAPRAWIEGRSTPTDGSALLGSDREGVTCIVCHRMIDPIYEKGVSPPDDLAELTAVHKLTGLPAELQNGQYIIDRKDRRRGPFDLGKDFFIHEWRQSAFHREAMLCSSCHDVSNPMFERRGGDVPQPDDTYILGALGAAHATQGKYDQFPLERTFSEWEKSEFAQGPIDMGGRFGGNNPLISTCQDCHMPDATGSGCNPLLTDVVREDLPRHTFSGAANWVLDAILDLDESEQLYSFDAASGLTVAEVRAAQGRNRDMLRRAADLEAHAAGQQLRVRVTNQTGHKLPSGYPEGRRMWVNVRLEGSDGALLAEYGHYDEQTATLDEDTTKVYHAVLGVDKAMSRFTGLPPGPSLHFAVTNLWLLDNRIPPRGFTNEAFAAVQAAPIGHVYADGQHWDDTEFDLPCATTRAQVRLYYQTASREYIEFLRDANVTNDTGQIVYDLWAANGKGAPVEMGLLAIELDCNRNGVLDACDIAGGGASDDNADGIPDNCVVSSTPPDGAIDARQPHALADAEPPQGWDRVTLAFNTPQAPVAADFLVTSSSGTAPAVSSVLLESEAVTLELSQPLPAGAWSDIVHLSSGSGVRLGVLPADVSGDGSSGPVDILALIDILNGAAELPEWATDINRSGSTEPADILRLIDLLNGAAAYELWNGRSLP